MLQTTFGKLGKFILGSLNHLHPVSQLVKGWVFQSNVSVSTGKRPRNTRSWGAEEGAKREEEKQEV